MVTHSYTETTATVPLLTLEKGKKQLRIEASFTAEDETIQSCIDAAQVACQDYINRSIAECNFIMECDSFSDKETFQRNYENDVITKIEYYEPGATEKTLLDESQYQLRKSNIIECFDIKFLSKPATAERPDAVIITVKQGFSVVNCPTPIIQAIKLRLADFYEIREDRNQNENLKSNSLLRPYRKF